MHDMGEHMSCLISITKMQDALEIPLACPIHALGTPLGLTRVLRLFSFQVLQLLDQWWLGAALGSP